MGIDADLVMATQFAAELRGHIGKAQACAGDLLHFMEDGHAPADLIEKVRALRHLLYADTIVVQPKGGNSMAWDVREIIRRMWEEGEA